MAYQQHEKSPGGSTQSPVGTYDEGIEAVTYQHGQYPEHYIPGQESPQVYHGQHTYPVATDTKNDFNSTPGTNAKGSRMLGMKKRVFWILVGLLVLLLVLVVGLGAGLGVVAQADSSGYVTFLTYNTPWWGGYGLMENF